MTHDADSHDVDSHDTDAIVQVFGNFNDALPDSREGLTIVFSPTSVPLMLRWRTGGLSANFMADYFATFFPGREEAEGIDTKAEVKDAISFVANELLENAMKFADSNSSYPTRITLQMHREMLLFVASNSVDTHTNIKFKTFIGSLLGSDPFQFYADIAEKGEGGGLGFVTMIINYSATLGWKFEPLATEPGTTIVTTMVQMPV